MKKYKYLYIKRLIKSKDYIQNRLYEMNSNVIYWINAKQNAKLKTERDFCEKMANMYIDRYKWYLNK